MNTPAFFTETQTLLSADRTFEIHPFQGKDDLLKKLQARLRGYAQWLPADWRLIVVVDCDDDDCLALKQQLEATAAAAGLIARSRHGAVADSEPHCSRGIGDVVFRIKALIQSHYDRNDDRFQTAVLQLAAYEAKQGHGALAREIRTLVDKARSSARTRHVF